MNHKKQKAALKGRPIIRMGAAHQIGAIDQAGAAHQIGGSMQMRAIMQAGEMIQIATHQTATTIQHKALKGRNI